MINYKYNNMSYHDTTCFIKDDAVFVLNEKNVLINEKFINNIFRKYKIEHNVIKLDNYQIAMTHDSYCLNYQPKQKEMPMNCMRKDNIKQNTINSSVVPLQQTSYERLEFLGDSIIHAVLAEYIFTRFNDQQEGFMTKLRTKLENNETLAHFTQIIGFDTYVLLSRYYEENNGRVDNIHILEDVFEAFIGAFFLDNDGKSTNFDKCRKFIVNLVETEIDIAELLHNETNYKDMLLKYAHTRKMPDPCYQVRNVTGMDNKTYVMYVRIGQEIIGVGEGNSKKKGEQEAAASALRKFGVIGDDSDDSEEEYELIDDN